MFDFAWSEIALIGVVALVAIGPKDMPVAIRTAARMIKKARRLAAEFQTHVDEMVREADLHEVRDQINSLRKIDLRSAVEKMADEDGSVGRALRDDPFKYEPKPSQPETPSVAESDATPPGPSSSAFPPPVALPPTEIRTVDLRPAHEIVLPPRRPDDAGE